MTTINVQAEGAGAAVMEIAAMGGSVHVPGFYLKSVPEIRSRTARTRSWASDLVSDFGDDHEMGQDFGESVTRASDRALGFVFGAGVLALAWAVWNLV